MKAQATKAMNRMTTIGKNNASFVRNSEMVASIGLSTRISMRKLPPIASQQRNKVDFLTLHLAAQQDERKRIAQELHDTLLQGFTGIALKLDALTTNLPPALSQTKRQLLQTLKQMDYYLGETRRSISNLRSPTLQSNGNLSQALLKASERVLADTTITVSFSVQGAPGKIDNAIEHHLLRIFEESLANVVKHARATSVEVVLDFTSKEMQLQIRDDGCGFEPANWQFSKSGHFGLLGIEERVASVSGTLSVDSAPGRGTRLLVTIPIKEMPSRKQQRISHYQRVEGAVQM